MGTGYVIVRPLRFDECFDDWQPELTAGCHGKALCFGRGRDAQEIADLLNKAHLGFWQIEAVEAAPACRICDAYEVRKYKSNLQESVAQHAWFDATSEIGYVIVFLAVETYADVDVKGTVKIGLYTPLFEELPVGSINPIYTKEVASELSRCYEMCNHHMVGLQCTAMAVEVYQRHWNQQAEVGVPSDETVAAMLKEARDYMNPLKTHRTKDGGENK